MNEYDMCCSVEHHFRGGIQPSEAEYEESEKQRLLTFSKSERSLWCWICGFMLDPCEFQTPKEGVVVFDQHLKKCEDGWRRESEW